MSASPRLLPDLLRAALVRRPHGVRGEVRIEVLGGDPGRFVPGVVLVRESDGRRFTVRSARPLPDGDALLALEEVTSRTDAEALRGAYLCVSADGARRLGEDEWFVAEVVGLRAVDVVRGVELGTVVDVESYEAHDVLVVEDAGRRRRFPMVRAFVRRVDPTAGVIELTPWEEE